MGRPFVRRVWRTSRFCFRWLRIVVWLAVLAVLCAYIYLTQIGLPDFLKERLVAELHSRGLDLQYEEMRLDPLGHIVAENIRFERSDDPSSPTLFISRVGLNLNWEALKHRRLVVDSLLIRKARLTIPLLTSNQPPEQLTVDDIQTELMLRPDDRWELVFMTARCLGARIHLSGSLANGPDAQQWQFGGKTNRTQQAWREYLHQVVMAAGRMNFDTVPEIRGVWRADAREPGRVHAKLALVAEGARTPWGEAAHFNLEMETVPPATTNEILGAVLRLEVQRAETQWGRAEKLVVNTRTRPIETPGTLPATGLELTATQPEARWGRAEQLQLQVALGEMRTNLTGMSASVELALTKPEFQWGSAQSARLSARVSKRPVKEIPPTNSAWADWAKLAPYEASWKVRLQSVNSPKLQLDEVSGSGQWRAPDLKIEALHANLRDGKLDAAADLDVVTRQATAEVAIDFDVKKLDQLLTTNALNWLGQFGWEKAPEARARGGVTLPAWTNAQPDWRGEVLPTLWMAGAFTNQAGSFRGVPFDYARSSFQFSNQTWHLPDLYARRERGEVNIFHVSDDRTRDHYWKIRSTIDVNVLKPLLDEAGQRVFDSFQLTQAPEIEGELWGRWRQYDRTGFRARVHVTNLVVRGEVVSDALAFVTYTNRNLQFTNVQVLRPEGKITLESGSFDFETMRLYFTNGFSTADPRAVTRAIGPKTDAAIEPFQFLTPPTARVNGVIPVKDIPHTDLRFQVEGGPFHWMVFNLPRVSGDLHWLGDRLELTSVQAGFYDGKLSGRASFYFPPERGTDFRFEATVWETDLKKLLTDINSRSNKIEGVLNGQLSITSANSHDLASWQGRGTASLRDGLLWDSPMLGFLSTPLNAIAPGIANNRASDAKADFTITNSVIQTENLEIMANGLRLQYRGTVDFQTRVNARVEAELLRDTPLVGKIFSLALMPLSKIFEYKVTGTLASPKPEPLWFFPRILLMPLQPIKTLRELLPSGTNAPPPTPVTGPPPVTNPPKP